MTTKKSPKSAADLYAGTNKRLTIMIILMSIWTVFLIVGSIILSIAAYKGVEELYAQGRELKDKSSSLYKEVMNDLKTEILDEVKNTVESSASSATNNAANSITDAYKQVLR